METIDYKVAAGVEVSYATLYNIEELVRLFRDVSGEYKMNFTSFCKGEFVWAYPNADLVRFTYCPITGVKIDWEQVMEEGLKMFDN